MEDTKVDELVAVVSSVATYGEQTARVFHNYSLTAKSLPRNFIGVTNIIDASAATVKQLLTLLAPSGGESQRTNLFSEEGLKYVQLLILETATVLTKFKPAVEEACLNGREFRKLQKEKWKAKTSNIDAILDPLTLRIDEKELLEKAERTNWDVAIDDLDEQVSRLYDLQLLVLLVFQVGSVAKLSKDM